MHGRCAAFAFRLPGSLNEELAWQTSAIKRRATSRGGRPHTERSQAVRVDSRRKSSTRSRQGSAATFWVHPARESPNSLPVNVFRAHSHTASKRHCDVIMELSGGSGGPGPPHPDHQWPACRGRLDFVPRLAVGIEVECAYTVGRRASAERRLGTQDPVDFLHSVGATQLAGHLNADKPHYVKLRTGGPAPRIRCRTPTSNIHSGLSKGRRSSRRSNRCQM